MGHLADKLIVSLLVRVWQATVDVPIQGLVLHKLLDIDVIKANLLPACTFQVFYGLHSLFRSVRLGARVGLRPTA